MTITSERTEGGARIVIDGNIDSASGYILSSKLMEVMEWDNLLNVDFDLATVKTVTSSAIGKLINFFKFMEQNNGKMRIVAISDSLNKQFKEIHLDRIIPIIKEE